MKIHIEKLRPRKFAWVWNGDTRILLVGLYWFVIGIDFGLKGSPWFKHWYGKTCPVCKESLRPNNRTQILKYHGACRTEGRKMARAKA